MNEKRRLTAEEWNEVRRRWEGAPEATGFAWLSAEILMAWGIELSRPALHKAASKGLWKKCGEPSQPLVVASPPASLRAPPSASPVVKVTQAKAPKVPPVAEVTMAIASRTVNEETRLTPPKELFSALLALGINQSASYRRCFPASLNWKPETVHQEASRLAADPNVSARCQELMNAAAEANQVGVNMVLAKYTDMVNADPREISEIRVAPCRFCNGAGHLYQRTDGELKRDRAKHEEKRQAYLDAGKRDIGEFEENGGGGYNVNDKPDDACPDCGGAGIPRVVLKDSRSYSPGALSLFTAAKEGKEGIEVKVIERKDALQQVARHAGFYEADKDPAPVVNVVNYVELDALYDRAKQKAQADKEYAKGRLQRLRDSGIDV